MLYGRFSLGWSSLYQR